MENTMMTPAMYTELRGLLTPLFKRGAKHKQDPYALIPAPAASSGVRIGPARKVALTGKLTQQYRRRHRLQLGQRLLLPKRERPLWQQKGWVKTSGNEYRGRFKHKRKSWPGIIVSPYRGRYQAYIRNPPTKLKKSSYRYCIHGAAAYPGYQEVHFHANPRSLDHAIGNVEDILA